MRWRDWTFTTLKTGRLDPKIILRTLPMMLRGDDPYLS